MLRVKLGWLMGPKRHVWIGGAAGLDRAGAGVVKSVKEC